MSSGYGRIRVLEERGGGVYTRDNQGLQPGAVSSGCLKLDACTVVGLQVI